MNKEETDAREKLIEYLDFLLDRDHIECRPTLRKYRVKLSLNGYLSTKEFTTVLKFLERDVKNYSRRQLRTLFKAIIKSPNKQLNKNQQPSTLETFLI